MNDDFPTIELNDGWAWAMINNLVCNTYSQNTPRFPRSMLGVGWANNSPENDPEFTIWLELYEFRKLLKPCCGPGSDLPLRTDFPRHRHKTFYFRRNGRSDFNGEELRIRLSPDLLSDCDTLAPTLQGVKRGDKKTNKLWFLNISVSQCCSLSVSLSLRFFEVYFVECPSCEAMC